MLSIFILLCDSAWCGEISLVTLLIHIILALVKD